jgi:hypothetical protein
MTEEELRLMFQRSDEWEAAQPKPKVRTPWFVRAPRCPHCGTAMVNLRSSVRDVWKLGIGQFYCRLDGFGMVYRVQDGKWAADPAAMW